MERSLPVGAAGADGVAGNGPMGMSRINSAPALDGDDAKRTSASSTAAGRSRLPRAAATTSSSPSSFTVAMGRVQSWALITGGAVSMVMHSMEFPQGNDWAKSVCSQVTRQLGDNDYAGLVVFGMDATHLARTLGDA